MRYNFRDNCLNIQVSHIQPVPPLLSQRPGGAHGQIVWFLSLCNRMLAMRPVASHCTKHCFFHNWKYFFCYSYLKCWQRNEVWRCLKRKPYMAQEIPEYCPICCCPPLFLCFSLYTEAVWKCLPEAVMVWVCIFSSLFPTTAFLIFPALQCLCS